MQNCKFNIDNNLVENAIRPLNRTNNYIFCGNSDSAIRVGIGYSLITSCKSANIEPREWLQDVLDKMPYNESDNRDLSNLLPKMNQV